MALLSAVLRWAGIALMAAWWLSYLNLLPAGLSGILPEAFWPSVGLFGAGVALICVGAVTGQVKELRLAIKAARETSERGHDGATPSH